MNIQDIINGGSQTEIQIAKDQVIATCTDLVKQTHGTVNLIKALTDQHGKDAILAQMSEAEAGLFLLMWTKINEAAEGTDYVVPTLID
jgi:hypothetical protein